ncbi:MAG: Bax inhibitor-1/YccA family protein [Alphaproteobacteria bacterium]|nr:Bax inhibitor-1/YccA family protein [Alphaproteobacteria bacterium]
MADSRNRFGVATDAQTQDVTIDQGLRAYMLRVYNYMVGGLAVSGIIAYLAATSGLWKALAGTPIMWIVVLAPIGLVWFLAARIHKMSVGTAQMAYWLYAALTGLSLGFIFLVYTPESITKVFFITAGTFGAMSLWGYTTKKDLTSFGSFLIMGLFGIIIASIVNIFLGSAMLSFVVSVVGVLVFVGLTAYDTQQIKNEYDYVSHDGAVATKGAIFGALRLYLDFINLFLMLLRLVGNRN